MGREERGGWQTVAKRATLPPLLSTIGTIGRIDASAEMAKNYIVLKGSPKNLTLHCPLQVGNYHLNTNI